MIKRLIGVGLAAVLAAGVAPAAVNAQGPAQKHKLVIQISAGDAKTWTTALNNVDNLVSALGADNVDIKVVAYGPGLAVLEKKSAEMAAHIAKTKQASPAVDFLACGVTMQKQGVSEKDLDAGVTKIPSGIVKIVELQEQGYSYVRP